MSELTNKEEIIFLDSLLNNNDYTLTIVNEYGLTPYTTFKVILRDLSTNDEFRFNINNMHFYILNQAYHNNFKVLNNCDTLEDVEIIFHKMKNIKYILNNYRTSLY